MIAEVQLSFGESVGQNEVASLLNDMTKDGQLGQFDVNEPSVAMAAISGKWSKFKLECYSPHQFEKLPFNGD